MKARLLCTALLALGTLASAADMPHGINKPAMDASVTPGDDFYNYANGNWMKQTVIPADQAGWGSFQILRQESLTRTRAVIEATRAGTPVNDFYASFLDTAAIDAKGLAPLKTELAAIGAIKDKTALAHALGETLRADVDPLNNTNFQTQNLFGLWTASGFTDSDHYAAYLLQGGLGMPTRDYYLDSSDKMKANQAAYRAYVARILTLAGVADAQKRADAIYALEAKIAKAHISMVENQDVAKANNLWKRGDFAAKAPGLDWDQYFAGAGLTSVSSFIVWQPTAFVGLSRLVASEPLDVWKDWMTFHRINNFTAELPRAFDQASFDFYAKTLSGTPEQQARWKRAVAATNTAMGDAVGQLYVARWFTPDAKARAQAMVKNIVAAFGKRLDALNWLAPATRAEAKKKLFTLYVGVGYPEKWRSYAGLSVVKGDALGNEARAEAFEYRRNLARIGKPVDRTEWQMTPQTVNAVNLPLQNALNFPAAILERPFFDAKAADAFNYGAIGAVIGHEISHSFDNQGAVFDDKGRLRNWWTQADFAHFQASGKALAAQFSAYRAFPDLTVNGQQTLGENIADNAGMTASHEAWLASLNGKPAPLDQGFTGEQQFFLANAQVWSTKLRDAALRRQILTNEHAPGMYRALGARNLDAWYPAFNVKPGQKLYLAPGKRVHVW